MSEKIKPCGHTVTDNNHTLAAVNTKPKYKTYENLCIVSVIHAGGSDWLQTTGHRYLRY
jgi:hypothetical protein